MEDHVLLDTLSGLGFKSNGKSATILVISTNSSEIRSHYNMKLNHRVTYRMVIDYFSSTFCYYSFYTVPVWIDVSSHVTLEMFILLLILLHVCCLIIRVWILMSSGTLHGCPTEAGKSTMPWMRKNCFLSCTMVFGDLNSKHNSWWKYASIQMQVGKLNLIVI